VHSPYVVQYLFRSGATVAAAPVSRRCVNEEAESVETESGSCNRALRSLPPPKLDV